MPNRVTLRDLAAVTGLHFTTVGRALRGDAVIHEKTRAKVRRAAEEMGYVHDPMLSALSAYRHRVQERFVGTIGVITTFNPREALKTSVRHRRMFTAAQEHAKEQGFKLESIQFNMPAERLNRILISRGIQGLVLPALHPQPGAFPDLDWSKFSTVALNYSITNLHVHRVCFTQGPSMHLHMRELQALGYRRIGLVLPRDVNVRSGHTAAGAYFVEQDMLPASEQVKPYFPDKIELKGLEHWLRTEKPDCVIAQLPYLKEWIEQCGYRVPQDLGVSLFALESPDGSVAGIDDQDELLGEAAVDMVISLLRAGERGIPRYPRYTLVEGRWVWGPTVRRGEV